MKRLHLLLVTFAFTVISCTTDTPPETQNIEPSYVTAVPAYIGKYHVKSVNGQTVAEKVAYSVAGGHLAIEVISTNGDTAQVFYSARSTNDSMNVKLKIDRNNLAGADYLPKQNNSVTVSGLTMTLRSGADVIVLEKSLEAVNPTGPAWMSKPWVLFAITTNDNGEYWNDFDWPGKQIYRGNGVPDLTNVIATFLSLGLEIALDFVVPVWAIQDALKSAGIGKIFDGKPITKFFDWDPPVIWWPNIAFSSTHMKSETLNFDWSTTDYYYGLELLSDEGNGNATVLITDHYTGAQTPVPILHWTDTTGYKLHVKFLSTDDQPFENLSLHGTLAPGYTP